LLRESKELKNLIEVLVKALVEEQDKVEVTEVAQSDSVTYQIRVAPDDLGKVIGRDGKIANALRTVVKAAAMKNGAKVFVDIES
jgi:predicted RNA-binding protein YlqC (UPF0109 family)